MTLVPAYEGLPFAAPLVGLGVALKDGTTRYVPLGHEGLGVQQVQPADFKAALQGVLEDAAVKKGGHDLKALCAAAQPRGDSAQGRGGRRRAAQLPAGCLAAGSRRWRSSPASGSRRTCPSCPPRSGRKARALQDHSPRGAGPGVRGSGRSAARRLAPGLWEELEPLGLTKLARELELPLVPLLARMERAA